jgi:hypothetical protein
MALTLEALLQSIWVASPATNLALLLVKRQGGI